MPPAPLLPDLQIKFHPNCSGSNKPLEVTINGPPVDIENDHFKGRVMALHDTGSEAFADLSIAPEKRGGVGLQIQGQFKKEVKCDNEATGGLWAGGECGKLQLNWIMQGIVQFCIKFARALAGCLHFVTGERTHLTFPAGSIFLWTVTPPGAEPPQLGSEEVQELEWRGPRLDIDTSSTYTLVFKTSFLDLFTWQLLGVPGVSPLPLERILGDIDSVDIFVFDLGASGGAHAAWRDNAFLQLSFARGAAVDRWEEEPDAVLPGKVALEADESCYLFEAVLGKVSLEADESCDEFEAVLPGKVSLEADESCDEFDRMQTTVPLEASSRSVSSESSVDETLPSRAQPNGNDGEESASAVCTSRARLSRSRAPAPPLFTQIVVRSVWVLRNVVSTLMSRPLQELLGLSAQPAAAAPSHLPLQARHPWLQMGALAWLRPALLWRWTLCVLL